MATLALLMDLLGLILLLVSPTRVAAKPRYITRLPNGANVLTSQALGHVNANGTGALNAFGRHFIYSVREWSMALCQGDSDGDGQTNGQELGDPCCEWLPGDTPRWSDGVSHPGDATQIANESLWRNLTCTNVTKLSAADQSSARHAVVQQLLQVTAIAMGLVVVGV